MRGRLLRSRVPRLLLVLAVLVASAESCRPTEPRALPSPSVALPAGLDTAVERIVDGDTLVVSGGHPIRLIGIDTPETKDVRRPVECYGREAAEFLRSLLPKGTGVRLVGDTEARDMYDRTLAYAYRLPDGLFVNAEIVRMGFAHALTITPNVAHADEFVALAAEARAANRGLWAACAP